MAERKILLRFLETIFPYENNPRKNDKAVEAVAASIRKFGFQNPILIDEDGVILAGHTRWRAAKALGLKAAPCIVASGLSESQKIAYRIADNKTAELAMWDFSKLDDEIKSIDWEDLDRGAASLDFSDLGDAIADVDIHGLDAFGFKIHELEGIDADADIGALLSDFTATSPQKTREIDREKEAHAAASNDERTPEDDRVIFTAEGKRDDFGADFWELSKLLYARGIKVTIK